MNLNDIFLAAKLSQSYFQKLPPAIIENEFLESNYRFKNSNHSDEDFNASKWSWHVYLDEVPT